MTHYPWYSVTPITHLKDMLLKSAAFGAKPAFLVREGEALVPLSYERFCQDVLALGAALMQEGFAAGMKVGLYAEGRWEWPLSYLAIACGNGVVVPVDKDLREQEVRHILDRCEAEILITSKRFADVVGEIRPHLPHLRQVILMEAGPAGDDCLHLPALLETGRSLLRNGTTAYPAIEIRPKEPVAIIYTSGTMGSAKGVVLSQHNIVSNMMDMCQAVYIDDKDTFLSVLPLHHTYECTCGMLTPLYRGCTIAYCDNLRRLSDFMQEVKPTMMLGVPLLFESVYRRIREEIQRRGQGKFLMARGLANLVQPIFGAGLRNRLFSPIHKKFGGRLRLLISGGAAVDPVVAHFFRDIGIHFLQGYGLTECAPIIAVNRPKQFRDSAAGLPLPSVEVRIEDGEICARGPNVMLGYYQDPAATAEIIRDGWLHTGDIGHLSPEGFLHIHGRMKSVIVLTNGKKVSPEEVEHHLNQSPFIMESLVWEGPAQRGQQVEEIQAIIVPHMERLDLHCKEQGTPLTDQLVEDLIRAEIRRVSARLVYYKRVRKFTLRWEEFDKTTTKKIKRYLYTEKFKEI